MAYFRVTGCPASVVSSFWVPSRVFCNTETQLRAGSGLVMFGWGLWSAIVCWLGVIRGWVKAIAVGLVFFVGFWWSGWVLERRPKVKKRHARIRKSGGTVTL